MKIELPPHLAARLEAFEEQEKAIVEKFDAISITVASKIGYDQIPWYRLTWYSLLIYCFLTINVMVFRPDFINVISIYVLPI